MLSEALIFPSTPMPGIQDFVVSQEIVHHNHNQKDPESISGSFVWRRQRAVKNNPLKVRTSTSHNWSMPDRAYKTTAQWASLRVFTYI